MANESAEQVNEFGDRFFGAKYNVWYKDDIEEKGLKKMQVKASSMRRAAERALGFAANKFIYRVELAEGKFKVMESDLPQGVHITPLATQRRWEDLTPKAMKKWSWAKDKLESMWYNHDLFLGVDKYNDGTLDLIYGYPISNGISYAVKVSARDFDAILKDPVRWLIERFGVEKAHKFLQRVKSKSFWENGVIQKIFSSVKKEVAEAHGVKIVDEASYSFTRLKKDPDSWYNKVEMLGHKWAKEKVEMIERIANKYGGTDWQKYIISNVFDFTQEGKRSWHYFTGSPITGKYLAHIQFCLRNGGSMSALQLLLWRVRKSGVVRDALDYALEYAAYKHDPEKYSEWYARAMGFYGLPPEEGAHRLKRYIDRIAPKVVNQNWA